jgi:hypothetical protein
MMPYFVITCFHVKRIPGISPPLGVMGRPGRIGKGARPSKDSGKVADGDAAGKGRRWLK